MQTKGETQKENEKLQAGRSKLIQGTAPIIRPAVRTTEMSKLIQLIRNDPNSISPAEFILLQSAIGYQQAVKLLVEAKQQKLANEKRPTKDHEPSETPVKAEEQAVKADEVKAAPALQSGKALLKTAMNKLKAMLTPKVKFKSGDFENVSNGGLRW